MIPRRCLRGLAVALIMACAAMAATPAAQAEPTGAQSALTAVTGQGTGRVIVSPTSAGQGTFDAQVKVNLHKAARTPPSPSPGPSTSRPMAAAPAPIS